MPKEEPKTNEDDLTLLKGRLDAAREFEKNERADFKRVIKAVELQRDVTTGGDTVTQKIKYPLIWGAYDNYLSNLCSTPPQTVLAADDSNDHVKTLYWRGILDYVKRKVVRLEDLKPEFVQSFIVAGKAVYKVGRETETQTVEQEVKDPETGKVLAKRKNEVVVKNQSFASVVDPRRVWISPETRYQGPILGEECPYVIEEMIKTKEYIEQKYDIKVPEKDLEQITINEDVDEETNKTKTSQNTDDFKRVRLYAYYGEWEIDGKKEPNAEVLFTRNTLIKARKLPYAHGKKPYIYLLNCRKFFKSKAMSVLEPVMDLDQEYNEHMNRIRTYIRRLVNPKWAKKEGTKVDEAALLNPDIGVIIDESEPNAFRPVSPAPIQAEIFEKATATEQLFQFLTSITYGKTALKDVGTATGQELAQQGADVKIGRMVRLLERAQEELETMLLQLEQQYAPKDGTNLRIVGSDVIEMIKNKKKLFQIAEQQYQVQAQAMMGQGVDPTMMGSDPMVQPLSEPVDEYANFEISPDGRTVYTSYTRDDIQGDFELYIVSQSSNRNNQLVRSKQILTALEQSATDPFINRGELWKLWFQLNGETETDRLVQTPTPMQIPQPGGAQPGQEDKNGTSRPLAGNQGTPNRNSGRQV